MPIIRGAAFLGSVDTRHRRSRETNLKILTAVLSLGDGVLPAGISQDHFADASQMKRRQLIAALKPAARFELLIGFGASRLQCLLDLFLKLFVCDA